MKCETCAHFKACKRLIDERYEELVPCEEYQNSGPTVSFSCKAKELEAAKSTVEQIYEEYLLSETDIVNLRSYDEELQQVHTVLEKMLAYIYPLKEANQWN